MHPERFFDFVKNTRSLIPKESDIAIKMTASVLSVSGTSALLIPLHVISMFPEPRMSPNTPPVLPLSQQPT
jgi:hypothetical protein